MSGRIACMAFMFLMAGCRGIVAVEGWAVMANGPNGGVVILNDRPSGADGVLDDVWVELWTADENRRLNRSESKIGYFSVAHFGPYQPGLHYVIKAGAPGLKPLKETVTLRKAQTTWARIELAPQQERQAPGPQGVPTENPIQP